MFGVFRDNTPESLSVYCAWSAPPTMSHEVAASPPDIVRVLENEELTIPVKERVELSIGALTKTPFVIVSGNHLLSLKSYQKKLLGIVKKL